MAKNDLPVTILKWAAVIFGLLFFVPRLLASISRNNAQLRTQTSPAAAADAQLARAINTAGGVGNSALGNALSNLLNPSKSGGQQGGFSSNTAAQQRANQPNPNAMPSYYSLFDPSKVVSGFNGTGYPNVPTAVLPSDVSAPNISVGSRDLGPEFGGDYLAGVTLASPDFFDVPSGNDFLSTIGDWWNSVTEWVDPAASIDAGDIPTSNALGNFFTDNSWWNEGPDSYAPDYAASDYAASDSYDGSGGGGMGGEGDGWGSWDTWNEGY